MARVSLIAAVAENGVIGARQSIPWRLSTDMKRFRRLTMGKPVIMGRKTYETIGKPLTGRLNIVVTHQAGTIDGVITAPDLDAALRIAEDSGSEEIFVAGGGEIYTAAMKLADRLYVTHVDATPDGDTFFPSIDPAVWKAGSVEHVPAGADDSAATTFVVYERNPAPGSG
jgi:dihydrofolate reductase